MESYTFMSFFCQFLYVYVFSFCKNVFFLHQGRNLVIISYYLISLVFFCFFFWTLICFVWCLDVDANYLNFLFTIFLTSNFLFTWINISNRTNISTKAHDVKRWSLKNNPNYKMYLNSFYKKKMYLNSNI